MKTKADLGALGRWLRGWVQPVGAIHGFHNHSVWGDNPFRHLDFTAGHSTFASPLLLGLAEALKRRPDARGQALLETLVHFQARDLQADGQFDHVGFQVGETLKWGLIHNVVPCVVLSAIAALQPTLAAECDRAVRGVLEACDRIYPPDPGPRACANQEYCRLWARMLHMEAFGHREWDQRVRAGLDYMIGNFHVRGLPDGQSAGVLRGLNNPDYIEPAEYYGLMIHPLLKGYQRYGERRYLDEAIAIVRHVVRNAWIDTRGQTRVHRDWFRINGKWNCIRQPMLIGGIGLTLSAIEAVVQIQPDGEMQAFLETMDRTYAEYQSEAGFILPASGWGMEQDVVPSSAWESHDFYHLIVRHGVGEGFWETFFQTNPKVAVVLGERLIYLESDTHWAVRGYATTHGLNLVGRKDRVKFGVDIPDWIGSDRGMPKEYRMPEEPQFLRTDDAIHVLRGRTDLEVFNASSVPFTGCRA